jgi:hypothetical protein
LGQVLDWRAMQTETSGGSKETELNELTAMPTGSSPLCPHMATTPVGNSEKARLRASVASAGFKISSLNSQF